jgi:hypothetical protein
MIKSLFRGAGSIALWGASMAMIVAVSLLLFGTWLLTWPLLRKSPRDKKIKAGMELASAVMQLLQAYSSPSPYEQADN